MPFIIRVAFQTQKRKGLTLLQFIQMMETICYSRARSMTIQLTKISDNYNSITCNCFLFTTSYVDPSQRDSAWTRSFGHHLRYQ